MLRKVVISNDNKYDLYYLLSMQIRVIHWSTLVINIKYNLLYNTININYRIHNNYLSNIKQHSKNIALF